MRLVLDCNAEAKPCSELTMQARHEQQLQDQFRGCEVIPKRPSIINMHASLDLVTIVCALLPCLQRFQHMLKTLSPSLTLP